MNDRKLTYISLFSSAGVGCYGFKMDNFKCVATNELIQRRLDIQKFNNKCEYDSGYILGDITLETTQNLLLDELNMWKKKEKFSTLDVLIATPPCQGMSVANHKKTDTEIVRNSLVVESIKLIKKIKPRFFIFENVASFMKTLCTDIDGNDKSIADAIYSNLGDSYSYSTKIINFKDYGACSSRQRTLVIGVINKLADEVSPLELFPSLKKEKTLKDVIGDFKPLNNFGEIDKNDIYHAFRIYPEHMRNWICDLKEGESAFDNEDDDKKPHQVKDGVLVINKQKNGDKYKRQHWNKVGPCVHTRNDQLASQNTVHPKDDRVFSIRELMEMMTIPYNFKWVGQDFETLNKLTIEEKKKFLKKEEIKIRQSIGEAVPTLIFNDIAKKISSVFNFDILKLKDINLLIKEYDFSNIDVISNFIEKNEKNLSISTLRKIAELSNTSRTDNGAFYTNKALITEVLNKTPQINRKEIRILEPSVGVGNFIPLILKKFEEHTIILDVIDIDCDSIKLSKLLLEKYNVNKNVIINYINEDFLLFEPKYKYDYIIGNPPFYKMKSNEKLFNKYKSNAINKNTTNICSFFLDKIVEMTSYISLVFPKFILNTPEFKITREYLSKKSVESIVDFGEKGFPGVLVETIAIFINNESTPKKTLVTSYTNKITLIQDQSYIFDNTFPYWIIYRNELFDSVFKKLKFDVFTVFRDRQIVNDKLSSNGDIRVLKSRNISDDGNDVIDIDGYDAYIDYDILKTLAVNKYINDDNVYLTPNMTYKPRMMKKPKGIVVNGSLAILIPKDNGNITDEQLLYFSSKEYRTFYQIARNFQTRSLNVDSCSVFFYGLLKETSIE